MSSRNEQRRRMAVALVHHPVLDRQGAVVTSAVTNIDVHDLSRSARTFGAESLYVTTPIEAQRTLVGAIVGHWTHGSSGDRIPSRADALSHVKIVASLEEAIDDLGGRARVEVWATAARSELPAPPLLDTYAAARARLTSDDARAVLVVLGTSWGLAPPLLERCDARLPPIRGVDPDGYNHLSVRSACAITLDRLTARDGE